MLRKAWFIAGREVVSGEGGRRTVLSPAHDCAAHTRTRLLLCLILMLIASSLRDIISARERAIITGTGIGREVILFPRRDSSV